MRKRGQAQSEDCLLIASYLPQEHEPGEFITPWQRTTVFHLPWTSSYGDCTISIGITPGVTEVTTWTTIALRVTQLITSCAGASFPQRRTGGRTKAGREGKIQIFIGAEDAPTELPEGALVRNEDGGRNRSEIAVF